MATVIPRLKDNLTFDYAAIVDILGTLELDIKVFIDMNYEGSMLVDNIDSLQNINADLIIIPLAAHPSELIGYTSWWAELKKLNKPFLVLTSVFIDNVNALYCPIWPIIYPSQYITIPYPSEMNCTNSLRHYTYSCLNNRFTLDRAVNLIVWEKYHRVLCTDHLVTMIYSEETIRTDPEAKEQLLLLDKLLDKTDSNYKEIFYGNLLTKFPIKNDKAIFNLDPFELMNNAFLDAYLNVITEHWHHTQTPFISEKSLKPILAGQLFVHTGSVGSLEAMRNLGFDTYDDIIDHKLYEDKIDLFEKMEQIHQYLDKIKNQDWEKLYKDTEQRRLNNRNLLLSNTIKEKFVQQLKNRIYEILR